MSNVHLLLPAATLFCNTVVLLYKFISNMWELLWFASSLPSTFDSHVMSRAQHFTTFVPILCLQDSSHLFFQDISWVWVVVDLMRTSPLELNIQSIVLRMLISYTFPHGLLSTSKGRLFDQGWEQPRFMGKYKYLQGNLTIWLLSKLTIEISTRGLMTSLVSGFWPGSQYQAWNPLLWSSPQLRPLPASVQLHRNHHVTVLGSFSSLESWYRSTQGPLWMRPLTEFFSSLSNTSGTIQLHRRKSDSKSEMNCSTSVIKVQQLQKWCLIM